MYLSHYLLLDERYQISGYKKEVGMMEWSLKVFADALR
jgi:hypothetical protein